MVVHCNKNTSPDLHNGPVRHYVLGTTTLLGKSPDFFLVFSPNDRCVVCTSQSQVFPMTLPAFFIRHNFSFTVNHFAVCIDLCVGFKKKCGNLRFCWGFWYCLMELILFGFYWPTSWKVAPFIINYWLTECNQLHVLTFLIIGLPRACFEPSLCDLLMKNELEILNWAQISRVNCLLN